MFLGQSSKTGTVAKQRSLSYHGQAKRSTCSNPQRKRLRVLLRPLQQRNGLNTGFRPFLSAFSCPGTRSVLPQWKRKFCFNFRIRWVLFVLFPSQERLRSCFLSTKKSSIRFSFSEVKPICVSTQPLGVFLHIVHLRDLVGAVTQ